MGTARIQSLDFPRVVIVGRPNVGKSTLFNKIVRKRRALVHDFPGVTRDRMEFETRIWAKAKPYDITLIDTGGLGGERFDEEIQEQVREEVRRASVILFVVDARDGVHPLDLQMSQLLRESGLLNQSVIGVVNKVDTVDLETDALEFYSLGVSDWLTVSAEHRLGMDDLYERIAKVGDLAPGPLEVKEESTEELPEVSDETYIEKECRVAIIGKPNVGKSTLLNAILDQKRMITSNIAGTTVDAVDVTVEWNGHPYLLVDTAGVRRRNKTEKGVEVLSVIQTQKALERSDVAILVIDGKSGVSEQDEKVISLAEKQGCSLVLLVNKWDLLEGTEFERKDAEKWIRKKVRYLNHIPVCFGSALEKRGLRALENTLRKVFLARRTQVPTSELNTWVKNAIDANNPRKAKFYYGHQFGRNPPSFVFHVNDPARIHFSLKRNLQNGLRRSWGFEGSPIRMKFVKRASAQNSK